MKQLSLVVFFFFLSAYLKAQYSEPIVLDSSISLEKMMLKNADNTVRHTLYLSRPDFTKSVGYIPRDIYGIFSAPFENKNWIKLGVISASTLLMIPVDQDAIHWVRHASRQIGLKDEVQYNIAYKIGTTKILKIPKNLNTALYQMGEGGTSMVLAGGLYFYGLAKKDRRAMQTSFDLAETFVTMGVTTQLLKRISGRQSPFRATVDGGEWKPFPSFKQYQNNTSNFDAFPSGHLATMVATVTVMTNNYPEKKWIKPVGYSLCGLTAWAMMNTEVHWLSDYPLAIAVGYLSGKITSMRHRKPKTEPVRQYNF